MNFSARWSDDMSVGGYATADARDQMLLFHSLLRTQRFLFVGLALVSAYICVRIGSHTLMHFNFRVVMCSASVYALLFSASRLGMYILLEGTAEVSDRTAANTVCMITGTLHTMSILALILSMFMVGVERYLATIWVRHYEHSQRVIGYAIIAGILIYCTLFSAFLNTKQLYNSFDLTTTYKSCIPVEMHPEEAFLSFSLGIAACLWQFALYRRNRIAQMRRVGCDPLTIRYQQIENVHTTKLIAPVMVGYTTMCLMGLWLSGMRYRSMARRDFATAKVFMQTGYILIDVCVILIECFIVFFHPGLRASVVKDALWLMGLNVENYERQKRRRIIDVPEPGMAYFKQLEICWN